MIKIVDMQTNGKVVFQKDLVTDKILAKGCLVGQRKLSEAQGLSENPVIFLKMYAESKNETILSLIDKHFYERYLDELASNYMTKGWGDGTDGDLLGDFIYSLFFYLQSPLNAFKRDQVELFEAVHRGDLKKTKELIDGGMPVNLEMEESEGEGKTLLSLAFEKSHKEIVKFLIDSGADVKKVRTVE